MHVAWIQSLFRSHTHCCPASVTGWRLFQIERRVKQIGFITGLASASAFTAVLKCECQWVSSLAFFVRLHRSLAQSCLFLHLQKWLGARPLVIDAKSMRHPFWFITFLQRQDMSMPRGWGHLRNRFRKNCRIGEQWFTIEHVAVQARKLLLAEFWSIADLYGSRSSPPQ